MCRINGNFNCLLKMPRVLFAIFCCFSYGVNTQTPVSISTLTLLPQSQSSWEGLALSHQAEKEVTRAKKDKFSHVLNLLKTALSEELENSQCQITEELIQDSALSSLKSILEEEQFKKETADEPEKQVNQNQTDSEKALYQKIITKIASAFSKSQNITNNQNNVEIPTMIPIFKPRDIMPKSEASQNVADINPPPKQTPKSRAVSFVPEKIIQTNLNQVPSILPFNIPCQRAADVLDMAIPKEPIRSKVNAKPIVSPTVEAPKSNVQTHLPVPVTMSLNCADAEDTVAMLFKPQNISLMQIYGNLLKKITITVLVPYHMSKIGQK